MLFFEKGSPTKEIWYYEHKLPEGQKSYSKTKPIRFEEFQPLIDWWHDRKETDLAWKIKIEDLKDWDLDIKNPHQPEEEKQYSSNELLDLLHQSLIKSDDLLKQLKKELS